MRNYLLKELENDELLTRTIYPVMPPKVDYKLTELGKSLKPLVEELYKWGLHLCNYEEKKEDSVIVRHTETINNRNYTFYSMTEIGESLIPIIDAMYEWGENRINKLKINPKYNSSDSIK